MVVAELIVRCAAFDLVENGGVYSDWGVETARGRHP